LVVFQSAKLRIISDIAAKNQRKNGDGSHLVKND